MRGEGWTQVCPASTPGQRKVRGGGSSRLTTGHPSTCLISPNGTDPSRMIPKLQHGVLSLRPGLL